jgi:hypothetical protein
VAANSGSLRLRPQKSLLLARSRLSELSSKCPFLEEHRTRFAHQRLSAHDPERTLHLFIIVVIVGANTAGVRSG